MRKIFTSITLSLVLSAALFYSCQKEETIENENQLSLKEATIESPCECVSNWGESLVTYTIKHSSDETKYLKLDVYNEAGDTYFRLYGSSSLAGKSYNVTINDIRYPANGNMSIDNDETIWSVSDQEWEACKIVVINDLEVNGANDNKFGSLPVDDLPYSYLMKDICEQSCEESFTYTDNQDGTLTFHYIPAEDMIDVPVVFTFPQVQFITFLDGYEYESFVRPGKGNAQNMQAVLSFESCTEYSWTVQLVDCTAANATANGWTDFTVDAISKKNSETSNFTYTCPGQ